MSIAVSTYVWKNSKQSGSALVMLLAIADITDDNGDAYPGVSRLAEKCRVSDRQAKNLIAKLEEEGELLVYVNSGIHTSTGNTNLYRIVMPGINDNLPLTSPILGQCEVKKITPRTRVKSEGVKQASPLEQSGVKQASPQGVKQASPKTSGDTSVEIHTSDLDATRPNVTAPSIEEAASEILKPTPTTPAPQPPSSAAPPSPQVGQGDAPTVPSIIKAWIDALPAQPVENVPPYKNKHYRRIAQGLIDAGHTPQQVTDYVKAQLAEDWRDVKYVRFAEVGEKLPFWKAKKPPQYAHPSHKPFDYEAAENSIDGPIHPDVDKVLEEHLERVRKSA